MDGQINRPYLSLSICHFLQSVQGGTGVEDDDPAAVSERGSGQQAIPIFRPADIRLTFDLISLRHPLPNDLTFLQIKITIYFLDYYT